MPAIDIQTTLGKIHVVDDGSASQPVVVLWPSLFTDHTMYKHQLPELRAANYRTIAIDPPGHGLSPGTNTQFTMDECVEAAVQVLDYLKVSKPIIWLATSWGGFVGARMPPDRLKAVILCGSEAVSPGFFERMRSRLLVYLLSWPSLDSMVDNMVFDLMLSPKSKETQPNLGRELAEGYRSVDRYNYCNTVYSVIVAREPVREINKWSVPTLVLTGEEDKLAPPAHGQQLAGILRGRFVQVPGAGHLVPVEAPKFANQQIFEFLSSLSS